MKTFPLSEAHINILAGYGLKNVPQNSCLCLRFVPGEEILSEGADICSLFVVVHGSAKICHTAPNGQSLILCYYVSSGLIGELELMTGKTLSSTTVKVVTDFECIAINYQTCREELKTNLLFSNRIGMELAKKLSRSSVTSASLALCSGKQRLCTYILQASHQNLFSDILTDVACSVGLSYRHLFRILGELCTEGILEKRESGYYILNREALAKQSYLLSDHAV